MVGDEDTLLSFIEHLYAGNQVQLDVGANNYDSITNAFNTNSSSICFLTQNFQQRLGIQNCLEIFSGKNAHSCMEKCKVI